MAVIGLVADMGSYNFSIVKKDGSAQAARCVAWIVSDDGMVQPVTFPPAKKGERLRYETSNRGWVEVEV